jgi:hypothetical protein
MRPPAGGRQYIYWHPSLCPPLRPYLGNVAKLIRRRRISLKRDNHPKNPSAHPSLRPPIPTQPTFNPSVCPVTTVERMTVELIPKNPPSKSLRQKLKAFKYYYVLITIFKKENLVLVSSYKTCFNINSNFI